MLGPIDGYLSAALGGATGFSSTQSAAERGEISIADAMRRVDRLASERVRSASPEERWAVRERPKDVRTLRKALRRMLEHDGEHLVELSQREGGPSL